MNEYSAPLDDPQWVPAESWQDDDNPYLLAAAVEAEANYTYEEQSS